MTNAGMTAALAELRGDLELLKSEDHGRDGDKIVASAVARISATLDRIHPEPDVLAALGMVALGMIRELKESKQIGICAQSIEGGPQAYEGWHKRAEEILATAYPDSHWAKELALKQNARRSPGEGRPTGG